MRRDRGERGERDLVLEAIALLAYDIVRSSNLLMQVAETNDSGEIEIRLLAEDLMDHFQHLIDAYREQRYGGK